MNKKMTVIASVQTGGGKQQQLLASSDGTFWMKHPRRKPQKLTPRPAVIKFLRFINSGECTIHNLPPLIAAANSNHNQQQKTTSSMKQTIETITPNQAKEILAEHNGYNRNISKIYSEKLARDIRLGAFALLPDGISFDDKGNLLNGQHRLYACELADMPVEMVVTRDVPAKMKLGGMTIDTFKLFDGGRARTVGQMLGIGGTKNGNRVAAVIRALVNWILNNGKRISVSQVQAEKIITLISEELEWVAKASNSGKVKVKAPYLVPLAFYRSFRKQKAADFARGFFSMENLNASDPAYALDRYRQNHITKRLPEIEICDTVAQALWLFDKKLPSSKTITASGAAHKWLLEGNAPLAAAIKKVVYP